jgi:hypothetical protein
MAAEAIDGCTARPGQGHLVGAPECVSREEVEQCLQLLAPDVVGWLPQVSLLTGARRRQAGLAVGAEQGAIGQQVGEAHGSLGPGGFCSPCLLLLQAVGLQEKAPTDSQFMKEYS